MTIYIYIIGVLFAKSQKRVVILSILLKTKHAFHINYITILIFKCAVQILLN